MWTSSRGRSPRYDLFAVHNPLIEHSVLTFRSTDIIAPVVRSQTPITKNRTRGKLSTPS